MKFDVWYFSEYVRAIDPVTVEPVTFLSSWQLVELKNGDGQRTRHLIGCADFAGRVSTDLVAFDVLALRATTQSGRVYVLEGPPGHDSDADWLFAGWLRRRSIPIFREMTPALLRLRRRKELGPR